MLASPSLRFRPLALLAALALLVAVPARAQVGIGGQVGDPTGLSLKFGAGSGALALAVGWDLRADAVSGELHYLLRERPLQGGSGARLFFGPGAFVRVRDGGPNRTAAGVSLGVGLSAPLARELEIYGLVSPRLRLTDRTDFEVGGGLGLRLYL